MAVCENPVDKRESVPAKCTKIGREWLELVLVNHVKGGLKFLKIMTTAKYSKNFNTQKRVKYNTFSPFVR